MLRYYLPLVLVLLAAGCQSDPYAPLLTTAEPQSSDLVGRYVLIKQTLTSEGLAPLEGKICSLELRDDGTFLATNLPPWQEGLPDDDFFTELVSGEGVWRIDSVGGIASHATGKGETVWGVYLDSNTVEFQPAGLMQNQPPYQLIYTLGDPDSGQVLILEREP